MKRRDARRRGGGSPEFPHEVWKSSRLFRDYFALVGPTTEAAESLIFGAHAAGLSVLVGRSGAIPWAAGHQVPVVPVVLVGNTSTARKSTTIDDMVDVLVAPLMPKPTAEGEPLPMEVVVGSGSGEGFVEAIADQRWRPPGSKRTDPPSTMTGRRALFVVHELGGLLEKIRRGQAGNMLDFIINSFDARERQTHRTRAKSDSPPVTMTGAVGVFLCATTLSWLAETMTQADVMAGLANRFLWFVGDRGKPIACRPPIPRHRLEEYQARARLCLQRLDGNPVVLSSAARKLQRRLYGVEYNRVADSDMEGAATARSDAMALRLSILLAVGDGTTTVEAKHLQAAWDVVAYSQSVAALVVQQLRETSRRATEDRVLATAKRVQMESGRLRPRDVWQRLKGPTGMDGETFNRAWSTLVSVGDIVVGDDGTHRVEVGDVGDGGTGGGSK